MYTYKFNIFPRNNIGSYVIPYRALFTYRTNKTLVFRPQTISRPMTKPIKLSAFMKMDVFLDTRPQHYPRPHALPHILTLVVDS